MKQKNLISIINDRYIFPHIKYKFLMRSVDDEASKFVLAINVFESDSIVRWCEGDFNESVFIKGDGNALPANHEDIISLAKRKYGVDKSITEIKYDPSNWKKFNELCKEFRMDKDYPTIKELQNNEIIDKNEYVTTGFLMFKDDYNDDSSRIHCRLWKGKDKSGIVIDNEKFKGCLSGGFYSAMHFIERNTKVGFEKNNSGGRTEIRSYPIKAIREAIINAIAHRDYSINGTQIDIDIYDDRIDITSPGSWLLPNDYSKYEIGMIPSIRRNSVIASCFEVASLMECIGSGFQTISNEYRFTSLDKQPSVRIFPGFIVLRLYDLLYEENTNIKKNDFKITKEQQIILEALKKEDLTTKELQVLTKYNSRSSFRKYVIDPLLTNNLIYRIGNTNTPYPKYGLKK